MIFTSKNFPGQKNNRPPKNIKGLPKVRINKVNAKPKSPGRIVDIKHEDLVLDIEAINNPNPAEASEARQNVLTPPFRGVKIFTEDDEKPQQAEKPDSLETIPSKRQSFSHTQGLSSPTSPSSLQKLIPGYSGWYRGKIIHTVGRSEFPLAVQGEFPSPVTSTLPIKRDIFPPSMTFVAIHKNPAEHSKLVLTDIRHRISTRYPSLVDKRLHVKQLFQCYDKKNTQLISVQNFRVCLQRLNIMMSGRDVTVIIDEFVGNDPDTVHYMKFVEEVCGPGVADYKIPKINNDSTTVTNNNNNNNTNINNTYKKENNKGYEL